MSNQKNIWFYFLILFVYFTQSFIFEGGSSIGSILIIPIILINLYCLLQSVTSNRWTSVISLSALFLLVSFSYFIWGEALLNNVPTKQAVQILKTTLLSVSCIFPIYYWSCKNRNLDRELLWFALGYLLVLIYNFHTREIAEEYVDNLGYYYINIIPFLFLIKRKYYLRIGLCLFATLLVIESAKRGAIITVLLVDIYFFKTILKSQEIPKKLGPRLLLLALVIGASIYAYWQFQSNEYVIARFKQLEEGQTSGRDYIYNLLLSHWLHDTTLVQLIFGSGYCAVPTVTGGLFAHNDWLELLIDFGLFGVFVYLAFFRSMLTLVHKQSDETDKDILILITGIWFMKTLFSMSYLDENNFMLAMLMGYIAGKYNQSYDKRTI